MSETTAEGSRTETSFVQVGDRLYPVKSVKNCKTCRSRYRSQIEQGILAGMPYGRVVEQSVDPHDDHSALGPPTYQGIMTHVRRGHMPLPYSTQRSILESRADELGRSIEEGQQLVMDSVGTLRAIVQRGFERMNNGEIQPTMGDFIAALRLEGALTGTQSGDQTDDDMWRQAFVAYMEIVKMSVSADAFQRIGDQMRESAVIKQIMERQRAIKEIR